MVRTQIQLADEQFRLLKRIALEEGVSIAELIRRSVDLYIRSRHQPGREELKRRSLAAVGKYGSGRADIGVHHDHYLAEIYAEVG